MRTLMKVGFALLLLAFVLIGSAYAVLRTHGEKSQPNQHGRMIETVTREVGKGVTAVELAGPIDLTLRYGPAPSLVIKGEQRLLGNIETTRDGNTLHIGTRGLVLSRHRPLEAELVLPALTSLSIDGSGDTSVDGFSGERVKVQLDGSGSVTFNGRYRHVETQLHGSGDMQLDFGNSNRVGAEVVGSGHMTLAGTCTELEAKITGSGSLEAHHLRADMVNVRQLGSGNSSVSARKAVSVSISGSGDVDVYGSPAQRSVSRTGSGDVTFND